MSDNVPKNLVGGNVRTRRIERSYSQQQLVDLVNEQGLNITTSTLSKIEKLKRGVSDIELKALSIALSVSVDQLFGDNLG